jgi:tRNA/tmRNA/rRNA uracil-C5-methylase (TrmA/RlmC/RlmD family)
MNHEVSEAVSSITALPAGCVGACPGCRHRDRSARASAGQKTAWLRRSLAPWESALAGLRQPEGSRRLGYRDKVSLHAGYGARGWDFGLLRRDELVPIPDCPVHSERVNAVLRLLGRALPPPPRFPLAFVTLSGAQATLVLKGAAEPDRQWLDPALRRDLSATGLEGLWLNLHPSAGRRLYAKRGWRLLWGTGRSRDAHGCVYGPAAFQQLLPELYARSLQQAADHLDPGPHGAVVDLYCGIGVSLRRWLAAGAPALGVELGGDALDCARLNAPGAQLLRGACAQRLPQVERWLAERGDAGRLLYANPPRTGLEPAVRQWISGPGRPRRIAYLSCSSGTLGRDLAELCTAGYRVQRIQPYDFFPLTHHVETLALLSDGR